MEANPPLKAGVSSTLQRLRGTLLLLAALLLVTAFVAKGIGKGELSYYADEAPQAVTGLYFADFISDLPLAHPVRYTYDYYAQYPSLGLIHWPPLFHFVEGVLFLLLGPSVAMARLAELLFVLLGSYFWYRLVAEVADQWTAVLCTLLLASLPSLLTLEKTVMLEVPSLALCIAATYFWLLYLRSGAPRQLFGFALFATLALLTKQQTVYLVLFCLLTLLAERKWRLLLDRTVWKAFGLCLFFAGPFYLLTFSVHWQTVVYHVMQRRPAGARVYLYYWAELLNQLGLPLLALSALGIVTSWWRGKREVVVFMLLWIASCYIALTALAAKEVRYIIYWLPPFAYFAVAPFTAKFSSRWLRVLALCFIVFLTGRQVWSAWRYELPYLSGYAPIAQRVVQSGTSGIVLFDGEDPGNFIFYQRAFDPHRRFIVMRKALYATRILASFGNVEILHTREELEELIKGYGIRFIVVTENGPVRFEVQNTLRALLESPQFKVVARSPIITDMPERQERSVVLYENQQVTPPTEQFLRVKMLTLNHDIVVPLADFKLQ